MSNEGYDDRQLINERQLKLLRLKDQRYTIETYCQNVTQYFDPDRGRYPGDDMKPDQLHGQRMDNILDSATMEALEIAQNGMNSGLTPSSRPWFRLEFEDEDLNKYGPSRNWLEKLEDRVYKVLRQGGFYSSMHSTYGEVLIFANGCIAKNKYPHTSAMYKDLTFGEYWISSSCGGKIDTVFRSRWMTAKQIVEMFGRSSVSSQVLGDYERFPYNSYEVIHCVQPRKNYNPDKTDPKNMKFESVWWENASAAELSAQMSMQNSQGAHVLRESGYKRLPYYVPRWKVTGSNMYGGSCPGMKQLGEAKYLQDLKQSIIVAIHKELDPPVLADDKFRSISIRSGAGGITYGDMSGGSNQRNQVEPLYKVQFNIQAGKLLIDDSRAAIKNGFFNQLFLMLLNLESQADRVTAKQISEMKSQGLLQLGPFIEHVEEDVLNEIVNGAIDEILELPEWYGIEPPPQEVQGKNFNIVYISMLAQAQREVGKGAIDETIATIAANAQVFPEAIDLMDIDIAMRERADLVGTPAKIMRSEEVVQAIRQKRQQEMQKKEAMQEAEMAMKGAQTLGKTPMDPSAPNALTEIAKQFSQGGGTQ